MPLPPRRRLATLWVLFFLASLCSAQSFPPAGAPSPHPGWVHPGTLSAQKQANGIQYVANVKSNLGATSDDLIINDGLAAPRSVLERLAEALCGMQLWVFDDPNADPNSKGEFSGGKIALDKRIWCQEMPGGWVAAEILHEAGHTLQTLDWETIAPPQGLSNATRRKFQLDQELLCYAHSLLLEARAIEQSKDILTTEWITGHITNEEFCDGLDEALGSARSHLNAAGDLLGLNGRASSLSMVLPALQTHVPSAQRAAQRGRVALDLVFDDIASCLQSHNCD